MPRLRPFRELRPSCQPGAPGQPPSPGLWHGGRPCQLERRWWCSWAPRSLRGGDGERGLLVNLLRRDRFVRHRLRIPRPDEGSTPATLVRRRPSLRSLGAGRAGNRRTRRTRRSRQRSHLCPLRQERRADAQAPLQPLRRGIRGLTVVLARDPPRGVGGAAPGVDRGDARLERVFSRQVALDRGDLGTCERPPIDEQFGDVATHHATAGCIVAEHRVVREQSPRRPRDARGVR